MRVFLFRHLAMQKLRTTIIQAVLANLFKLTTKKMEWFMGKLMHEIVQIVCYKYFSTMQGCGTEVFIGKVKNLFTREKREELPRILLPVGWIF
jgi:hypothetical protein